MRSLVIDDHRINYVLIKNLLIENFPGFESVDTAESVSAALKLLEAKSYDLIFLDMKLADGEGFDILREMTEFTFVIVISSHKDYALEAFKYNVIDYIVKPVKEEEFRNAVNKVLLLSKKSGQDKALDILQPDLVVQPNKILINHRSEYVVIDTLRILFIRAHGKYSEIHLDKGEFYVSSKNLKEFENVLSKSMLRVHHSYLVNIAAIVSYSKEDSTLKLTSRDLIPVSVRKRDELSKVFRIF